MADLRSVLGGSFNVDDVPLDDYTPLPPGEYAAVITETEMKETRSGGMMLVFTFDLQDSGRKFYENLNLVNSNPKAETIARQDLAKIVKACGLDSIADTNELHGKRINITLDIKKGVGTYVDSFGIEKQNKDRNESKGYAPYSGTSTSNSAPVASSSPPSTDATDEAHDLPWG